MPQFAAIGEIRSGIDPDETLVSEEFVVEAETAEAASGRLLDAVREHPFYDSRIDPMASIGDVYAFEAETL